MGLEMELREDPRFIPRFLARGVDDGQTRQRDKEADKESQMPSRETINNMVMRNPHPGFKTRREREEEPTPRTRLSQFVNALVEVESMPHGRPQNFVQSVIAQMVCQDLSDLLRSIGLVLDSIELSLHDDYILQQAMLAWRAFLGTWRNICYHQSALLQRMTSQLARMPDPRNKTSVATADLTQSLSRVKIKLDRLSQRVESTFQSLMSSITIVESSRAIRQAELVTKLTQLAFFFIPLSLVAGAFGMNINVSFAPIHVLSAY
jgi:Mg2+ and Co2+ transporter CorA